MRVTAVTSSRADLSILRLLLVALANEPRTELIVIATGMHRVDEEPLRDAVPACATVHTLGADLKPGPDGAGRSMGRILSEAADALFATAPDLLIATGDRLDMAPVVMAAVPQNIPILHLHGGELTYGAVDDRLRHAITKMAHIHCTATETAARRVIAMGEEPWRVHVTGAPALDSLMAAPELDADEFAAEVGLSGVDGLRLLTVHPETNSDDPLAPARAVFGALETMEAAPTIITAPNSDPGGDEIRQMIAELVTNKGWLVRLDTLGTRLYANAMRHASVMVGNSSSGIVEAGLFDLPVINVGARQEGREQGANVINVTANAAAVAAGMRKAATRPRAAQGVTPYGDGNAVGRIMEVLTALPERRRLLAKRWYDHAA